MFFLYGLEYMFNEQFWNLVGGFTNFMYYVFFFLISETVT